MADKRESGRIKTAEQKRVLDDVSRKRRQRKALEALESDNFSEDPHADLKMSKKAPKFEEAIDANAGVLKRPGLVDKGGSERFAQQHANNHFREPVGTGKKKRKSRGDFKQRYRKTFAALIEEEQMLNNEGPTYFSACIPHSKFPERHFCAVCGFPSHYTCVQCGARFCCVRCLGTHQDTRCLKWTA